MPIAKHLVTIRQVVLVKNNGHNPNSEASVAAMVSPSAPLEPTPDTTNLALLTTESESIPVGTEWDRSYLRGRTALAGLIDLLEATPAGYALRYVEAPDFLKAIERARQALPTLPKYLDAECDFLVLCRSERDVLHDITEAFECAHLLAFLRYIQKSNLIAIAMEQVQRAEIALYQQLGDPIPAKVAMVQARQNASLAKSPDWPSGHHQVFALSLVNVTLLLLSLDHAWIGIVSAATMAVCAALFMIWYPKFSPEIQQLLQKISPHITALIILSVAVIVPVALDFLFHLSLIPIVGILPLGSLLLKRMKS